MRKLAKRISTPFLQRFVRHYFSKERKYKYKGVDAIILPGVFFPHFTLSTRLLIDFLSEKELSGQRFLELGCGSGMISVYAAQKGAEVVASDINPTAIDNVAKNADRNQVKVETVLSDLFANLKGRKFDYVVINPPYYPKNPNNDAEKAWYCGENFEYFEQLFSTMDEYLYASSKVYMILSEDCDLNVIKSLSAKSEYRLNTVLERTRLGERNYIFQLERI